MIVEYVRYVIPIADRQRFQDAFAKAGAVLSRSLNCLGWDLARCHDDPGSYILRIRWDSVDGHLRTFQGSGLFQDYVTAIRDFVPAMVETRHYDVIGGSCSH
jgi:quinol monooxygenase YgiN